MKKFLLAAAMLLAIPAALQAQAEPLKSTRFAGERITGLDVGGGFEVELIHTADRAQNRVEIELLPTQEPHLELELGSDGVVHADWEGHEGSDDVISLIRAFFEASDDRFRKPRPRLKVYLGELSTIDISGSTRVEAAESQAFSGTTVRLETSGSGSIRGVKLDCTQLTAACSGSGSIALTGNGRQASLKVSGSGEIHAGGFRTEKARVSVSGSGTIEVNASRELTGSISGSGRVRHAGSPERVEVSRSGSGSVGAL